MAFSGDLGAINRQHVIQGGIVSARIHVISVLAGDESRATLE